MISMSTTLTAQWLTQLLAPAQWAAAMHGSGTSTGLHNPEEYSSASASSIAKFALGLAHSISHLRLPYSAKHVCMSLYAFRLMSYMVHWASLSQLDLLLHHK